MLNDIKLLLGISDTSKDTLLNLLIARCEEEFKSFTHQTTTTAYQNLIESMVIYNFNLLGTEGVNSENYSGASYSYSTDYPQPIMREMKRARLLVTK